MSEPIAVGEAGRRYLLHLEQVMRRKRTTIQDYRIMLRRHLMPYFGTGALAAIDPEAVARYIVDKQDEGLAPKTVANHLTFLHGLFGFAVKRGWATVNPVASVDRPRTHAVDPDIRFLTRHEVEALLLAVPADPLGSLERPLYLVAATCGLRQGELVALQWRDVDLVAGVLRVRRTYTRATWGAPKSRRSSRAVPMIRRVAAELGRLRARTLYPGDEDLVFAHPELGTVLDAAKIRRRFKQALERAGLRPLRFHDLRHTFGTQAAAAGVPLRTLQEWMGHRDYTTTLIYADYVPREHDRRLIEAAFAPAGGVRDSDGADRVPG